MAALIALAPALAMPPPKAAGPYVINGVLVGFAILFWRDALRHGWRRNLIWITLTVLLLCVSLLMWIRVYRYWVL